MSPRGPRRHHCRRVPGRPLLDPNRSSIGADVFKRWAYSGEAAPPRALSLRMVRRLGLIPLPHIIGTANLLEIWAAEHAFFASPASTFQRPVASMAQIEHT